MQPVQLPSAVDCCHDTSHCSHDKSSVHLATWHAATVCCVRPPCICTSRHKAGFFQMDTQHPGLPDALAAHSGLTDAQPHVDRQLPAS